MSSSDAFQPIASHALTAFPHLNAAGFEASKGFPSQGSLRKNLASLYLFVIHPSARSTKGRHVPAHRAKMIPEMWYLHITKKSIDIGRGRPPMTMLGRRRRAEIVIECTDRDLVDMATGKARAQTLYENGKLAIRGKLDKALEVSKVIAHERSKLYRVVTSEPGDDNEIGQIEFNEDAHGYSIGSSVRARL